MPVASPQLDTRSVLANLIRKSAKAAIEDPSRETASRMVIMGHLLNPSAGVVDSAISRFERGDRFPTLDRERIADYITHTIEQKVLGISRTPMNLKELVDASSPFAWSDSLASACVRAGITEVRRARARRSSQDFGELADAPPSTAMASFGVADRMLSAEDLFLAKEQDAVVHNILEQIDSWEQKATNSVERIRAKGKAIRALVGVPKAFVADSVHRRWLSAFAKQSDCESLVRESLIAHREIISCTASVRDFKIDERLLDVWLEFSATDAGNLLAAPPEAAVLVLKEAALFSPRPREPKRVELRRVLKKLSDRRGWSTLVMRLEQAWSAEFFDARCDINGYDNRTDEQAEIEREQMAAGWLSAANEAIAFPGSPFGTSVRTPADVCGWIDKAYQMILQKDTR
jgi:hypothetical protein